MIKVFFPVVVCLVGFFASFGLARSAPFARGADIGWLSEMEAKGLKFYDRSGAATDGMLVLKETGMESIRLRVWVNPKGGWCGEDDVVRMAVRAKKLGFRLMIDFHYSDSWADPGKQTKPAGWASHSIEQLNSDVRDHTLHVLAALKTAGVSPEWVQVGNEVDDGLLWEEGRASRHMDNFARFVATGYAAVKQIFPNAKVIVHVSNGYDDAQFRRIFDGLTKFGATFDVIGISLYPKPNEWQQRDAECLATMQDMISRFGKEVMICEVGMEVTAAAEAKAFLSDIIAKTKSLPDGKGLGVFYWEPECCRGWEHYSMGAFADDGRPTIALEAFK